MLNSIENIALQLKHYINIEDLIKIMKKIVYLFSLLFCGLIIFTSSTTQRHGFAGRTGSPGEQTCQSSCHNSFALNSGTGSVVIITDIPNNSYKPGTLYNISVNTARVGSTLFGFGLEALNNSGANVGTLQILSSSQTHTLGATISGNLRTSMTHVQNAGAVADTKTFSFKWLAPAAGMGNVNFYTAGVCGNGDDTNKGDYVYTSTLSVTEDLSAAVLTNSEVKSFDVYQDLTNQSFAVSLQGFAGHSELSVYELSGKLMYNSSLETDGNPFKTNPIQLKQGVYIVRILNKGSTISKKIML